MPRILVARNFTPQSNVEGAGQPAFRATNPQGHTLAISPVKPGIVRVVHELPRDRYPQKLNGSIQWEKVPDGVKVETKGDITTIVTSSISIQANLSKSSSPQLSWFTPFSPTPAVPIFRDSPSRAYSFDAQTGGVVHFTERENYLPVSEDEYTKEGSEPFLNDRRNEFVYGLGETSGGLEKSGRCYTMEGRDALSYDWEKGNPLYKVCPFYTVYNKETKQWVGIYYNSLADSKIDLGAENDVLFGCFRSYRSTTGPLDYYLITGDGTLPSVVTAYASLVSHPSPSSPLQIQASSTLPPLSQFGYLSSSLSLAAEPKAQEAIIEFLKRCRTEGFPVDGLYLSSGWCQDEQTGDRNYFSWNLSRYPSPSEFGVTIEQDLQVQVIVNIKPFILHTHPFLQSAEDVGAFVKAAPDAVKDGDPMRTSEKGSARTLVWSSGFGDHKIGSYIDYSSKAGSAWWQSQIVNQLLSHNLTGMWIDNNEMAGLFDDDELFAGEVVPSQWGGGETRVGNVGKASNTLEMARSTYEVLLRERRDDRPVVVSRSGVPGIQKYAHATWSGDNSTTWKALKWGTKMTLSVGMSFGPGLYGHDIGGFAGTHHPSPELLVRWCQNGAWHSRFTVHSWKEISTTLWMYNESNPEVTEILRDVLQFRYRLAPSFYSLYVSEYQRKGWPVLRPLLWYHSEDPFTLKMDEEALFGSHTLVASVTTKGDVTRTVYLPAVVNGGSKADQGLWWCEMDTGRWTHSRGEFFTFDAPLDRTPVLIRSGGILVLGGDCTDNIYDGTKERTVLVFPSPSRESEEEGIFTLIEDDGKTNDHTKSDEYTELLLSFRTDPTAPEIVEVDYKVVHLSKTFKVGYEVIWWKLPVGDRRELRVKEGSWLEAVEGVGDREGQIGIKVDRF
ncbi:hypothetical protein T439DRAFT_381478 [Meredithblackwellia eburnea MCA 4105]